MRNLGTPKEQGGSLDSICVRIVEKVAHRECTETDRLPLLAHVIDPDSLADFVRSAEAPATVVFEYAGYEVQVNSDGGISLSEANG